MNAAVYRKLGNRVFARMQEAPSLTDLPTGTLNYWRRFIKHSPVVLAPRLGNRVTLIELYATRIDWITYLIQKEVLQKVYGAYSRQQQDRIARLIRKDEVIIELAVQDPDAAQDRAMEHGLAYKQFVNEPKIPSGMTEKGMLRLLGLTGEALELYEKDKLTVERLLVLQPWLILSI
jgi:hypothetical protein